MKYHSQNTYRVSEHHKNLPVFEGCEKNSTQVLPHSSEEERKGFTLAKLNPIQHYHGQLLPDTSTYNIVLQISQ